MKMSLRLMILRQSATIPFQCDTILYILMTEMFEELQLAICPLGQDGSAEGFHNLLDGNGLAGELIFRRAIYIYMSVYVKVGQGV